MCRNSQPNHRQYTAQIIESTKPASDSLLQWQSMRLYDIHGPMKAVVSALNVRRPVNFWAVDLETPTMQTYASNADRSWYLTISLLGKESG